MTLSRRDFLFRSALGAAAFALPFGGSKRAQAAPGTDTDPVLVTVFLRGAADGLNLVVPKLNRQRYDALRPTIAIPNNQLLAGDSDFGFHPGLGGIKRLFDSNDLAVIHAIGSKAGTRSHFKAQDIMERGGQQNGDGWVNKALGVLATTRVTDAIALGNAQASLAGSSPSLTTPDLAQMQSLGAAHGEQRRRAATAMKNGFVKRTAKDAYAAVDLLQTVPNPNTSETGLHALMLDAAALIKADIGVRALALDMQGWDTHSDETNMLNNATAELSAALEGFWNALAPSQRNRTVVMVMTEFGRTAAENGSFGTDHGTASAMFLLGGRVRGGQIMTKWPGLNDSQLYEGRDLKVTTDYRDVFGEVLDKHMKISPSKQNGAKVLEGYTVKSGNYVGVLN